MPVLLGRDLCREEEKGSGPSQGLMVETSLIPSPSFFASRKKKGKKKEGPGTDCLHMR